MCPFAAGARHSACCHSLADTDLACAAAAGPFDVTSALAGGTVTTIERKHGRRGRQRFDVFNLVVTSFTNVAFCTDYRASTFALSCFTFFQ